jgi:hypothetical protein
LQIVEAILAVSDRDFVRESVILLESFPLKIIPSTTSRNGLYLTVGGLYTSLQFNEIIIKIKKTNIYFRFVILNNILEFRRG